MSDKGLYRLAIADLKMAKFAISTNDEVVFNYFYTLENHCP